MKENEYKCAMCQKIYKQGWSEEEAGKELEEKFSMDKEDCEVVCEYCYNEIMKPL